MLRYTEWRGSGSGWERARAYTTRAARLSKRVRPAKSLAPRERGFERANHRLSSSSSIFIGRREPLSSIVLEIVIVSRRGETSASSTVRRRRARRNIVNYREGSLAFTILTCREKMGRRDPRHRARYLHVAVYNRLQIAIVRCNLFVKSGDYVPAGVLSLRRYRRVTADQGPLRVDACFTGSSYLTTSFPGN